MRAALASSSSSSPAPLRCDTMRCVPLRRIVPFHSVPLRFDRRRAVCCSYGFENVNCASSVCLASSFRRRRRRRHRRERENATVWSADAHHYYHCVTCCTQWHMASEARAIARPKEVCARAKPTPTTVAPAAVAKPVAGPNLRYTGADWAAAAAAVTCGRLPARVRTFRNVRPKCVGA